MNEGSSSQSTAHNDRTCHVGFGTIATALVAFSMALLTYFGF